MNPNMVRSIVVDADVARSAGTSDDPMSSNCREFLVAMRRFRHEVVMSPAIDREWRRHRSKYAVAWLAQMESHRKVVRIDPAIDLASELAAASPTPKVAAIVDKDRHLIEAALECDRLVASRDKTARRHFCDIAITLPVIRPIAWVDPCSTDYSAVSWLRGGAKAHPEYRLLSS